MSAGVHVLEIDFLHVGMGYLAGAELIHQPAFLHDADARTGFLGPEQIVGGHQDGGAVRLELQQQLGEFVAGLGIQAGRRFVQQQRPGLLGQRNRHPDLLPHPLRIRPDPPLHGLLLQAHAAEKAAILLLRIIVSAQLREVAQVLQRRQVPVQHHLLGNVGEQFLGLQGFPGHVQAAHGSGSAVGLDKVEEEADGGGLARAVGAEQAVDVAALHGHVQPLEGFYVAVALRKSCSLQQSSISPTLARIIERALPLRSGVVS